jgi:hypothetical protein
MKIKISKSQWEKIGKTAGWIKEKSIKVALKGYDRWLEEPYQKDYEESDRQELQQEEFKKYIEQHRNEYIARLVKLAFQTRAFYSGIRGKKYDKMFISPKGIEYTLMTGIAEEFEEKLDAEESNIFDELDSISTDVISELDIINRCIELYGKEVAINYLEKQETADLIDKDREFNIFLKEIQGEI